MGQYRVAVVGATGAAGQMTLRILEERKFPVKDLQLFASDLDEDALTYAREGLYPGAIAADLSAERAAHAVRGHWQVENALHWTLDVVFKDDQSRLRKGHGANNMAIVRHFAINLVRAMNDKRAIKRRRKVAGWNTGYLASILGHLTR